MLPFCVSRFVRLGMLAVAATVAFAQICTPNSTATQIHSEGLAEKLGDLTVTCTGGTIGNVANASIFLAYSSPVANRLDAGGAPTGISITITGAVGSATPVTLNNPTLLFTNIRYTVAATAAVFTFSGVRAGVGLVSGTGQITATATITGLQAPANGIPIPVGFAAPSLLSTSFNNGLPCGGSPLPDTRDFPTFASTSLSSFVRVTESTFSAFSVNDGGDNGLRLIVKISGYGTGVRAFVPDFVVGSTGTAATSVAPYLANVSSGSYTPGQNQLLLARVSGADANGIGGSVPGVPAVFTTFTGITEIGVTGGNAYAVYEVLDSNANGRKTAQFPVFLTYAANNCSTASQTALSVSLGPVSNVAGASASAPIPRFISSSLPSDCSLVGDCGAFYFPKLVVDQSSLTLNASSLGPVQNASIRTGNGGGGQVVFTASVAYPPGAASGWLNISPSSGINNVTISLVADPSALAPGTYTATVTINAGSAGQAIVGIALVVGPVGVTIQGLVNAASFASGPVVPGSFAALFGLNLGGNNVGVTFTGLPATVVFKNSTQINLLVPASLATQGAANVVVTVDGKQSNTFRAALAPNAPGIFTPGIVNADGSINTATATAPVGSTVAIYLTGMTTPLASQATVNIAGATGIIPDFAGAQGTFAGLVQINVQVPQALTPGTLPLSVCIPGLGGQPVCSNTVNLYTR